jgi:hypothetical protein
MENLAFYQIENPTTKQIFEAIINLEYVPLEKIAPKAKQIKVLLLDSWSANEVLITFEGVTNCGGRPIFYCDTTDLHEVASESNDWYELSEEEQNNKIELLAYYARTYDKIFNL